MIGQTGKNQVPFFSKKGFFLGPHFPFTALAFSCFQGNVI